MLETSYKKFKHKFEQVVKETIPEELLSPEIKIDLEIGLSEITPKFYRIIKLFGPFGPRNMKPVFLVKNLKDTGYSRKVGEDQSHLKLSVISEEGQRMDGIGFNLGSFYDKIANGNPFSVVFTIEENHWNGNTTLQLNIKDIKLEV